MTAQHTPGHWSFTNEPYDDGTPYISVFAGKRHSGDGFNICGIIRPEDARLIAAAPDLLTALRWLRAFWRPGSYHDTDEVRRALIASDDAIDKATGK